MKRPLPIHRLTFLLLFGALFSQVSGQMANTYTYSYTQPTYAAITGTALVSGAASWDNNVYTNVPIEFTFYFEGLPYTTIGVSSNGFIWFGTGTVNTAETNPISDASLGTGTINGVIAGYATNLLAFNTNNLNSSPTGAPEISYATSGSPCSRIFIVQWKGAYASSTPPELGQDERVDLQIQLYETTNEIALLPHVNPYPYIGSSSGQVGIRGATNTDFKSLQAPPWNGAAAQTTNNAAIGTLDPSYPATKSSFNFIPPACTYNANTTSTNASCGNNGTITITVSGGTGLFAYDVNNGTVADTNLTGQFSGLGAGTYITAVSNGICAVSGCTTLTSNVSTPTATNTGPVCVGGSVTLQTPAVSGAIYSWTGPNGFTSSQQNPVITNVTIADSGTYTIVDTVGGCAGGAGTTHVTISGAVTPPKVGSNSPICAGTTLTLMDSTSGATYSWTGPNSFTSIQQNPTVVGAVIADSGTYSVINTVAGCSSSAVTVHVVINPAPAAPVASSNGPIVCAGDTIKLFSTLVPGTYSWSGPAGFSAPVQNPIELNAVVADSGNYIVYVTVNGCKSDSSTTHVVVSPAAVTPVVSSNSPVCAGDTIKFTATDATNGVSYTWEGPNSFSSNQQNPVIANSIIADDGFYTVTASVGVCAGQSQSVQVVVNNVPAAPSVSSNSPVCTGGTINLNAGNVPGASYTWSGPNSFSDTAQNPTIPNATSANSGTYYVYTSLGNCKSSLIPVIVSVGNAPTLSGVTSNSPVCSGAALNLSAPSLTGASYSWTGPNSFSDTAQNPTIANLAANDGGDYIIVAHFTNCTSAPDTITVTVNQSPQPPVLTSAYDTICSGDSVQVCAPNTFTTYAWSNGTSATSCTMAANAGGYWVTVTDANSCSVISQHKDISAYPVSSVSIVVNGDTLVAFGGIHYQWLRNDTVITGATQSVYIVPITGEYSVAVTDTNGCTATSSQVPITVTSVGINEVKASFNLSVYPNPASGSFNVVYTGADDKNIQLNMYNILGQGVKQENLSFINGKNKAIDISDLPKGVYLLQFIQQGGQLLTKKLVVE